MEMDPSVSQPCVTKMPHVKNPANNLDVSLVVLFIPPQCPGTPSGLMT